MVYRDDADEEEPDEDGEDDWKAASASSSSSADDDSDAGDDVDYTDPAVRKAASAAATAAMAAAGYPQQALQPAPAKARRGPRKATTLQQLQRQQQMQMPLADQYGCSLCDFVSTSYADVERHLPLHGFLNEGASGPAKAPPRPAPAPAPAPATASKYGCSMCTFASDSYEEAMKHLPIHGFQQDGRSPGSAPAGSQQRQQQQQQQQQVARMPLTQHVQPSAPGSSQPQQQQQQQQQSDVVDLVDDDDDDDTSKRPVLPASTRPAQHHTPMSTADVRFSYPYPDNLPMTIASGDGPVMTMMALPSSVMGFFGGQPAGYFPSYPTAMQSFNIDTPMYGGYAVRAAPAGATGGQASAAPSQQPVPPGTQ